ncbi:phosphatidylserine decarboxylase [Cognatiyoonia sp. IB215446]|uniref:phosphatidylserine decarboxylase n=1 Tax=Cognatiyoonia sp. IB215446 TaxID=3097355 RepID=UPI002A17651F|nr:phosphatidylserine decarboxylase [Cognatiyoonia sp. IB215446]MDX8349700.1 phosphatidylserine decarboxylase [Cognatiyoonia sp. IB215446]
MQSGKGTAPHSMNMLATFIKPMHPEGRRFVVIFAAITFVLFWIWNVLGWIGVGLTIWCYYFFRDPQRTTPIREGLIVSPADGVVSQIEKAAPPPELGMPDTALTRVSVFMNVFNCHVNRAPVAGEVAALAYRPGKFLNASLDKASEDNERNSLCLQMPDGRQIAVVQIAGLVARRIVCFIEKGAALQTGERFGLIRFGSRLDVYLPEGVAPLVAVGQGMIAGETVLADLKSDEPHRDGRTA